MHRRAVAVGACSVFTAGCVDRLHDLAASTPRDLAVRSRFVDGNSLVDGRSALDRPAGMVTHAASFRSSAEARRALRPDAAESRAFADATAFVDDGGEAVLLVAQRLTAPAVELRLGAISRTGDRSLRIAVDETGVRGDVDPDDPVVKTLLLRLADERGPPKRLVVSVDGDRAGVTV
ncbi:MAG: hypothetical protein R6U01_12975 [Halorubrum sp.]|uniref:hypothetical protein n=1 Tax=Halorubrum sp. TaxID=1879286 RepID=UPI003970CC8A